jgi:hypothetical protein
MFSNPKIAELSNPKAGGKGGVKKSSKESPIVSKHYNKTSHSIMRSKDRKQNHLTSSS